MNAAIFRFFFTLAPELRRLARERRNGKQRQKASHCGGFFVSELVLFQAAGAGMRKILVCGSK
jgi:hypothetical protein